MIRIAVPDVGSFSRMHTENIRARHMGLSTQAQRGEGVPLQNFVLDRYRGAFTFGAGAFVDAVGQAAPLEVGFKDRRTIRSDDLAATASLVVAQ